MTAINDIQINSESGQLQSVILGIATDQPIPKSIEETYDPDSRFHFMNNTYPSECSMTKEIETFASILKENGVKQVLRPENLKGINQLFARDIGFVIDSTFVKANVIKDRSEEFQGISQIVGRFPKVLIPPADAKIEGGDVICYKNHVFIGTFDSSSVTQSAQTARTNAKGIEFIKLHFPTKIVHSFALRKHDADPSMNCLHLDCCFQPVGHDLAILCPEGFMDFEATSPTIQLQNGALHSMLKSSKSIQTIFSILSEENIFLISKNEMRTLTANIFSISPSLVVSDQCFTRLNSWLASKGIKVVTLDFSQIRKQGGLLRCVTLPLFRENLQ